VVVQSAGQGKGATFIVRLPIRIAVSAEYLARAHAIGAPTDAAAAPKVRLDGLRILLVDDDREALDLASVILSTAGAAVATCTSAVDAVAQVQQWRPDVLVSDIEIPDEDGYALIRRVRALEPERGGRTPAVALTAYGGIQDRMQSLTAGFSMHVPKPVNPDELTTIIASLAGRRLE